MDLKLKNKVVLVTASGKGIGASVAREFLEEGAKVLINDHNDNLLHSLYKTFYRKHKSRVDMYLGDASDETVLGAIKKHILLKWGRVDILVANLGSGKPLSKNKLDISEWQKLTEINLFGAVKLTNTFLPEMKKQKSGSIVMVSSITGIQRSSAPPAYSAAKSSIISLVKNLSAEVADYGIRINAVAPGNIYFKNGRWEEKIKKTPIILAGYIKKDVPLKRFGKPEEIASAVVFLASPRSSFTTGECLVVDGGETRGY